MLCTDKPLECKICQADMSTVLDTCVLELAPQGVTSVNIGSVAAYMSLQLKENHSLSSAHELHLLDHATVLSPTWR